MVQVISPPRQRMTADEYYASPEYALHDFIQLIDGEMVIGQGEERVAASLAHQRAVGNSYEIAKACARKHGGTAYVALTEVYLDDENIFEPDVLYLAPESRAVEEAQRIVGAPTLVVEVLSPKTAKKDRTMKFEAYQRHGVQEYWLIEPNNFTLELYALRGGKFALVGIGEPGDKIVSSVFTRQQVDVAEILAT